jgi:plastocyanin
MSLLSLFLAACDQSTGETGYGGDSNTTQAGATPSVAPNTASGAAATSIPKAGATGPVSTEANQKADQNQVVIENFAFKPATLTVKVGVKVTWVNRDDVPHTANDTENRFKSGTLDTDGEFSYSFTKPGTYNYFCALHPKMTGQIIVK